MTKKECMDCENETMQDYADISTKYERLKNYTDQLEQGLIIKEKLNEYLREEIGTLRLKLAYKGEESDRIGG